MKRFFLMSVCCVLWLVAQSFTQNYNVVDLGVLPTASMSTGLAINQSGQVSGFSGSFVGGPGHAFLFNGSMTDLGILPGTYNQSTGTGVNASGQVAGYAQQNGAYPILLHAVLFSGGTVQDLGFLPNGTFSQATGINDAGQITGYGDYNISGNTHAFLYSGGVMTDLDASSGRVSSQGDAINQSGQVAGSSETPTDFNNHATLWTNGVPQDLGLLPGSTFGDFTIGQGVSTNGVVVGFGTRGGVTTRGFVYSGTMIELPVVVGGPATGFTVANAINPGGTLAVGRGSSITGPQTAYLWSNLSSTPTAQDLNTLIPAGSGWALLVANGVNDAAQITGTGLIGGAQHAFRLDPIIPYKAFVQQPINPDGSSIFSGSKGVVPVKFILTQNNTPTCTLPAATIALTRTAGGTVGTVDESTYVANADSGSSFRIDATACQYVYNLAAKLLGVGVYRVDIAINGDVVGSGVFALR